MQNEEKLKEYAGEWAYDMSIKGLNGGGLVNIGVINQSIEMILATPISSRLFNISFGSNFSLRIFDNMSVVYLQQVLEDTIDAINRWEDRITIIEDRVSLVANTDNNSIELTIPYIVNERKILGEFSKIIKQ